jgi:hypothetical protein
MGGIESTANTYTSACLNLALYLGRDEQHGQAGEEERDQDVDARDH